MKAQSSAGNAVTLGQGTLASRILGFVRDASIAALLGSGWVADALLVAFRLPNFARSLLADGAFAYTLVPAYRMLKDLDPERAWTFVRSMTVSLFAFFGFLVLVGAVFSDHIAIILAPGFHDMPDVLNMASGFMVLCLLSLPLVSGAAVNAAALMAEGRFKPPAYASAVFNVVVILSVGVAFILFGTGDERAPYALCVGVILAGVVQWGYQTVYLRKLGFSPPGPVAFKDPVLKRSLKALPQSIFGVGGHQVNLLLATFLASFLAEGSISALYFAERLIGFPLGIIGASMGLAALSDLSTIAPAFRTASTRPDLVAASKTLFTERLVRANRVTLFFALPAAVGTACLAVPLTSVIFGYGEFDHDALIRTSNALLAYLVGLPALALIRPLLAGLGALGDARTTLRAAVTGLAATGVFGAALLTTGAPWGPALAVSLAAWVNAVLLTRSLAGHGHNPLPGLLWPLKILLACGLMALCVIGTASVFSSSFGKVATVPVGILVYFAAAFALRLDEFTLTFRVASRMFAKKR
ncbi:MAG: murein biosynthesis integral membrane protein MurJ [Deltaproteobacteria bacterium]|nr:murein biosynthesis integral membrane protein MurJ [Deltaproteobacteria bacterium]